MPTLRQTGFMGEVVWLGAVSAETMQTEGIRSAKVERLAFDFDGPEYEGHAGRTRPACVRVRRLYPEGTEIANVRQISIVSAEELEEIAKELKLDSVDPSWLGANIVVRGIPDFTHIPPSSRLWINEGVSLTVDMENQPCEWPGKEIDKDHQGRGQAFPVAARGKRGVSAWVECPGSLALGDQLELIVPTQRAWNGVESS